VKRVTPFSEGAGQMTEPTEDDEDDTPWASPEIQEAYEVALGRFLLAFNRLDILLSEVIGTMLRALKRDDLVVRCTHSDFAFKLLVLDLLKTSTEGKVLADVSIDLMKQVAGERNVLAHGHFDQNPFDGTYAIVTTKISAEYPVARLDDLTIKANTAWDALRYVGGYYAFSDAPQE
jgi:hypothetical protein